MSERISFRERTHGVAVASGDAVSIMEPRVKYIKGYIGTPPDPLDGAVECGDGTEFPLKVTVDQLSEIFYRVKDARFTAGLAHSVDYGFATGEFYFTSSDPNANYFAQADEDIGGGDEHSVIVQRSYVDISPANLTLENQMWSEAHTTPSFPTLGSWTFSTGFTHYAELTSVNPSISSPPGHYSPYGSLYGFSGAFPAVIELGFTGRVGVVNTPVDGNFSPFHPGNELWLEMRFRAYYDDGLAVDVIAESFDDGSAGWGQISGIELSFVMTSGTPTCKLYGRAAYTHAGGGYIITATEWFPYATTTAAAAWNTDTGAAINGGPGA